MTTTNEMHTDSALSGEILADNADADSHDAPLPKDARGCRERRRGSGHHLSRAPGRGAVRERGASGRRPRVRARSDRTGSHFGRR
jgi:hypothetical protein